MRIPHGRIVWQVYLRLDRQLPSVTRRLDVDLTTDRFVFDRALATDRAFPIRHPSAAMGDQLLRRERPARSLIRSRQRESLLSAWLHKRYWSSDSSIYGLLLYKDLQPANANLDGEM